MIALLAMLVTAAGMSWHITFDVNAENVGVVIVTECRGQTPFFAYDRYDLIDPLQTDIRMRRQPTPAGARCTVIASVMRSTDDDPQHEFVGESTIVIEENK